MSTFEALSSPLIPLTVTLRPVVVGIDGSPHSLVAVAAAAREARSRGLPLRIVHAFTWPGSTLLGEWADPRARARVERVLDGATAVARGEVVDLSVTAAVLQGADASVLLTEAERADLLVIGHRGLGTLTGLLTGAVGIQLAGRTACPLLVVRTAGDPAGPVVVGVETPAQSSSLVEVAFREASRTGRPLVAVHAWHLPAEATAETLRGAVDRVGGRFPEVRATTTVRYGRAESEHIVVSAGASVLVVGSQGARGLRGLLLGSVAMTATQQAPCPVMIVPTRRASADEVE
jgi:nucleotide-binding universal stress UspA family protein